MPMKPRVNNREIQAALNRKRPRSASATERIMVLIEGHEKRISALEIDGNSAAAKSDPDKTESEE